MNRILKFFRFGSFAAFATLALASVQGHSPLYGQTAVEPPPNPVYTNIPINQVDHCDLWEADFGNSIEETVCLVADWDHPDSGVDFQAEVDQDLTWYEGYPDWGWQGDPNIAGLGAEAIVYNGTTEVADTGMIQGSISGGNPPRVDTPWYTSTTWTFSPGSWGDYYLVEGYYSECIDSTGTGSSSCSWSGDSDSGISVTVQIEAPV
jgi:hypothetical protein